MLSDCGQVQHSVSKTKLYSELSLWFSVGLSPMQKVNVIILILFIADVQGNLMILWNDIHLC